MSYSTVEVWTMHEQLTLKLGGFCFWASSEAWKNNYLTDLWLLQGLKASCVCIRCLFSCISSSSSCLFLFTLQGLFESNESSLPLSFISSNAGPCLLKRQLPAPDMWKRKWFEIKPHGFHLSSVCSLKRGCLVLNRVLGEWEFILAERPCITWFISLEPSAYAPWSNFFQSHRSTHQLKTVGVNRTERFSLHLFTPFLYK